MEDLSLSKLEISHLLEFGEVDHQGKKISVHDFLSENPINYQLLEVARGVIDKLSKQLALVHDQLIKDKAKENHLHGSKDIEFRDSLLKRIKKFENAFELIKKNVHPEKNFGFQSLFGKVHLTKGSPEILEYRKIKKALSETKKLAIVEVESIRKKTFGDIGYLSEENLIIDTNHRTFIRSTQNGAASIGTTWGNTQQFNVHEIRPTLCLDAATYIKTDDGGGVLISADGHGRGHDYNGPLDKNIANISHQACNHLSKLLKESKTPEEAVRDLPHFVEDTDRFLKECNTTERGQLTGSTNVAAVRVFVDKQSQALRIVGFSLGNQKVFLTDRKTGHTIQLNSLEVNERSYQCCLGGNDKIGKQYDDLDIDRIDFSSEINPDDALIWIATSGAWQNLDKIELTSNQLNLQKLSERVGTHSEPLELVTRLTNHIQENAWNQREKIPKLFQKLNQLDKRYRNEVDPVKKDQIHKAAEETQEEIKRLHCLLDDASITLFHL